MAAPVMRETRSPMPTSVADLEGVDAGGSCKLAWYFT